MYTRDFQGVLQARLRERLNFIQVVIGPRQVGKTTGVRQVFEEFAGPKLFVSADSPTPLSAEWLSAQWEVARGLGDGALLVVDEVQKVTAWAEVCKLLFDQYRAKRALKVVLLGSASLALQEGMSTTLAGRFEVIPVYHWTQAEMREAFGWDLEQYLLFGGYPAAAELIGDFERWRSFVRDSIIEPVLGRDISGLTRIAKPALFRQAFRVAMGYPSQVISYQKILGSLQEGGNAATVKHYLELFQAAFLVKLLEKFSGSRLRSATSSPKILPLAPALCNAMLDRESLIRDDTWRGRIFESVVGAHLSRLPGRLFYWSEGNHEVDFVREVDGEIVAYEVKSGFRQSTKSIAAFKRRFPDAKVDVIDRATAVDWLNVRM
jgi:predicted AAA+ superfamily ATPase